MTLSEQIERALVLIDVNVADGAARREILSIVEIFNARILSVVTDGLILEATGKVAKVDALMSLLERFGIRHSARSEVVTIRKHVNFNATTSDANCAELHTTVVK